LPGDTPLSAKENSVEIHIAGTRRISADVSIDRSDRGFDFDHDTIDCIELRNVQCASETATDAGN
jgi:hypothetical protein